MPKIFYREGEATIVLNRRIISQRYSLDQGDPIVSFCWSNYSFNQKINNFQER